MAGHTPGPWMLEPTQIDWDLPGHIPVSAAKHGALAQVVWKMEDDERSPQCEANAHLIAAAPDLLAVLLRARDVIEALDGTLIENEKLVDDYRAAIKKAQGTSQ